MALKNYIINQPTTYSIIDGIQYSKADRWCRFYLRVYKDEEKRLELGQRFCHVSGATYYKEIQDTTTCPPDISNFKRGSVWIIPREAEGEWKEHVGRIAEWSEQYNGWSYWLVGQNQIFYTEVGGSHYFSIPDMANFEVRNREYPTDDHRMWDKYFSPDLIFSSKSNLHTQCYLWLKSQEGFESVSDL